jgi:hypothetical protein
MEPVRDSPATGASLRLNPNDGSLRPPRRSTFDVVATPHPTCDAPVPSPGAFRDGASGIDFTHRSSDDFVAEGELEMPFAEVSAAGVAAADFDGDGRVDLFFTQTVGPNALFWGDEDGWARGSADAPWALSDELSATVRAVDFDGDGAIDLEIAGWNRVHLLRNVGGREFEDVTAETGILPRDGWAGGSAWIDYDGDGDLDLFAGGYVTRAREFPGWTVVGTEHALWRNDGDRFTNDAGGFGFDYEEREGGAIIHAAFRDLDDDGDPDLFLVNDFGTQEGRTRPWENLGPIGGDWTWLDRLEGSGLGMLHSPMGLALTDLDGDGKNDLWLSDLGGTTIFQGWTNWSWTEVSLVWAGSLRNDNLDASWSVIPIDLDGDGVPGVYIAYGPLPEVFRGNDTPYDPQADRFLVQIRDGGSTFHFEDAAEAVFPTPMTGTARGAAVADLNRDGVPDLVVSNVRGRPAVLLGLCTTNARLVVELSDRVSRNTAGIGAKVTVQTAERTLVDEVTAGGRGTFSSGEPVLFFGLGEAEIVERITIRWPDGEVNDLFDVPSHRRLTITRSP